MFLMRFIAQNLELINFGYVLQRKNNKKRTAAVRKCAK